MLTDAEIAAFRLRLLDERESLATDEAASKEERGTVKLDQQSVGRISRMDAMQRQAMAQAAQRRRAGREMRIAAALKRIEDGEFGHCDDCGEEIERKRLDLDPTLALCLSCAQG